MDYNTAKSAANQIQKEHLRKTKQLSSLKDQRQELILKVRNMHSSFQSSSTQQRENAFSNYKNGLLTPLQNELSKLETSMSLLEKERENAISSVKSECERKYKSDDNLKIVEKVKGSIKVLENKIDDTVGSRFRKEVVSQLDGDYATIDDDSLEYLVDYFEDCSKRLDSSIGQGHSLIDSAINTIENIFDSEVLPKESKYLIPIVIGIIVITAFAASYVLPVYFVAIIVFSVYNVYTNYSIKKAMIACQVVQDNIKSVHESKDKEYKDEVDSAVEKVNEKYDTLMKSKMQQKQILKNKMFSTESSAKNTFIYDDSEARKSFEESLRDLNNLIKVVDTNIETVEQELNKLSEDYKLSKMNLDDLAGKIQDMYLSVESIGSSLDFNPMFLIDIKDSKPEYFVHPEESTLFVYDKYSDCADLIRLLCLQLRIKMNPNQYTVTVVDPVQMGKDYVLFCPTPPQKHKEAVDKAYRILSTKENYSELLQSYYNEIDKRIRIIQAECNSIKEYNAKMIELESVPETYDFLFFADLDGDMLASDNFKRLIVNGGSVGIFTHIFINKSEFYTMGDTARTLVDKVGKIYELTSNTIHSKAAEYAKEMLIKSS